MALMKQHLEDYPGDAKVDFQDFAKTKLNKTEEADITEALALLEKIGTDLMGKVREDDPDQEFPWGAEDRAVWEAAHKLVPITTTPVPAPPPSDQKLSAEEAEKAMSIVKAREDASSCSVSNLAHLRTHATMDHFIHQIVNIDSEEKLAKQKLIWTRMTKAHAQLAAGLSQGSVELVKHVENLIKRQTALDKKAKEKAATEKHNADKLSAAVEHAKHRQSRTVESPLKKHAMFQIPIRDFDVVQKLDSPTAPAVVDEPWLCTNSEAMKKWQAEEVVSKSMALFGTKHKSEQSFVSQGRATNPMKTKQGKEETESYHAEVIKEMQCELHDVEKTTPANWSTTSFQFGFRSSYFNAALVTSGAALLRTLSYGAVLTIQLSVADAVKAFAQNGLELKDMREFLNQLLEMTPETLNKLKANGLKINMVRQERGSVLFIPAGSVVIETVPETEVITYGVRKSFFPKTARTSENLEAALTLMKGARLPTDRRKEKRERGEERIRRRADERSGEEREKSGKGEGTRERGRGKDSLEKMLKSW